MRRSGIVVLGCALLALSCVTAQSPVQPALDPSSDPRPETLDRDLEECLALAQELTGYRGPSPLPTRTRQRTSRRLKQKQAFDLEYTNCMRKRGHDVLDPAAGSPPAPQERSRPTCSGSATSRHLVEDSVEAMHSSVH